MKKLITINEIRETASAGKIASRSSQVAGINVPLLFCSAQPVRQLLPVSSSGLRRDKGDAGEQRFPGRVQH